VAAKTRPVFHYRSLTASSPSAAGPKTIVSDNGTQLTSTAILAWSDSGSAVHRTRKPVQNAFIESFNGRLRDKLLNETGFAALARHDEESGLH